MTLPGVGTGAPASRCFPHGLGKQPVQYRPIAFVEEQMLRSACCAIALSLLKLYLKEGDRYRQVDSNDVDLCEQVAGL
jgi:hypothetical protein